MAVDYENLEKLSRMSEQKKRIALLSFIILYAPFIELVARALGVASLLLVWGIVDESATVHFLAFGASLGVLITYPLLSLILSLILTYNRVKDSISNFFRARAVVYLYDSVLAIHTLLLLALVVSKSPLTAGLVAGTSAVFYVFVMAFTIPLITIAMAVGENATSSRGLTTAILSGSIGLLWSTMINYWALKQAKEMSYWALGSPQQIVWRATDYLSFNPLAAAFSILIYTGFMAGIIWSRLGDMLADTPSRSGSEQGY